MAHCRAECTNAGAGALGTIHFMPHKTAYDAMLLAGCLFIVPVCFVFLPLCCSRLTEMFTGNNRNGGRGSRQNSHRELEGLPPEF